MQTIVTHNGSFDPDDVLAVATVSLYLGKGNFQITRTRDKEIIKKADWVLDVGGIFDPTIQRFDHHQNGVPERSNGLPYSSFGLVWRELGGELCDSSLIADHIERRLAQPIDASDNQVTICNPVNTEVLPFEFYDVIDTFKPVWGADEDFDTGFERAVSFARKLLKRLIAQGHGNQAMRELISSVHESTDNKQTLTFDKPVLKYILSEFEGVQVAVSPKFSEGETDWLATVVPELNHAFKNRVVFPEAWAGLSGVELQEVSGIKEAVFCHKERYIFVAETKEAALRAASKVIPC